VSLLTSTVPEKGQRTLKHGGDIRQESVLKLTNQTTALILTCRWGRVGVHSQEHGMPRLVVPEDPYTSLKLESLKQHGIAPMNGLRMIMRPYCRRLMTVEISAGTPCPSHLNSALTNQEVGNLALNSHLALVIG
jgi:hypothetical protein